MYASLAVALVALLPAILFAQAGTSTVRWDIVSPEYGGLSGLDVTGNGKEFVAVSDNGVLFRGTLQRDASGKLQGVDTFSYVPLVSEDGVRSDKKRHRDMEAVALAPDGTRFISVEGRHRVLAYPKGEAVPRAFDLPKSNGVSVNTGFEAMALDDQNRLFALPESSRNLKTPFPIWRRDHSGTWRIAGHLPRRGGYRPVGADFGPDGAVYILSRAFNGFAFSTRVERSKTPDDPTSWQEIFASDYGDYDNLEGLATWRDRDGNIRLIMVSDDNFNWYQVTQFVEHIVRIPLP